MRLLARRRPDPVPACAPPGQTEGRPVPELVQAIVGHASLHAWWDGLGEGRADVVESVRWWACRGGPLPRCAESLDWDDLDVLWHAAQRERASPMASG
jgi:hypothetical protein